MKEAGLIRVRGAVLRIVVLACALVVPGCKKSGSSSAGAPPVEAKIELTGAGLTRPTTFTFAQLASMKMTRLDNVLMRKTHEDNETTSWEGPTLESLFSAARIKQGPMNITLEADDGSHPAGAHSRQDAFL